MMMRRVLQTSGATASRSVSTVAPTLYLRKSTAAPAAPTTRASVYALQRFAKAQGEVASADVAKYQSWLDGDLQSLEAGVVSGLQARADLLPKLDRYPEMTMEQIPEVADTLQKKLDETFATLGKQVEDFVPFDPDYFNTSKFQILEISQGAICAIPEGDITPGAVEILPGQVIKTKVNGEEVMLEIDEIDEGFQLAWYKIDIPVPVEAEILWDYPYDPLAVEAQGTTWTAASEDAVATAGTFTEVTEVVSEEETLEPAGAPKPRVVPNVFAPLLSQVEEKTSDAMAAAYKQAIMNPSSTLDLKTAYAVEYDREVVEAKRDAVLKGLQAAQLDAPLPSMPDVMTLQMEHTIVKCELIDRLRMYEMWIQDHKLEARLHERKLQGEVISIEEEMDYHPMVRDHVHLEHDLMDPDAGQYAFKLLPNMAENENFLNRDCRFDNLPEPIDPLNSILESHLKATPLHKKLEQKLLDAISNQKMGQVSA